MEDFSKVFKNTAVIYVNSKVEFLHRVGLSVRVNYENSLIEVYREEGRVIKGRSSSRGKLIKVRFKGKPTLEGLCELLSLKLKSSKLTFFIISEVFVESGRFATVTQDVNLTEFLFELPSGKVLRAEMGEDPEPVAELRPAGSLQDFLRLTPDLWKVVDRLGLTH
ncbi:hypothetical protein HG1285_05695 [Hydrogenivirga sp. 128-5-R1-1]|nr:hypothetical protein HG1285_05695 [Hydrogenivirga sp. 128-5-R1-1]